MVENRFQKYYRKNKGKISKRRKIQRKKNKNEINRLARQKYKKLKTDKPRYKLHRKNQTKNQKIRAIKYKLKALKKLGGKCKCCGCTEWWNLEIDHIKPHPVRNRGAGFSHMLYKKIVKNEISVKNLQILCAGCNRSKNRGKKCTLNHELNV